MRIGRIKIISRPEGDAPPEIRDQWIGVEMNCHGQFLRDRFSRGIKGIRREEQHSYSVFQVHAIAELAKKSPKAADFWKHIGFPRTRISIFTFRADSVQELSPVPILDSELENELHDEI